METVRLTKDQWLNCVESFLLSRISKCESSLPNEAVDHVIAALEDMDIDHCLDQKFKDPDLLADHLYFNCISWLTWKECFGGDSEEQAKEDNKHIIDGYKYVVLKEFPDNVLVIYWDHING